MGNSLQVLKYLPILAQERWSKPSGSVTDKILKAKNGCFSFGLKDKAFLEKNVPENRAEEK